MIYRIRSYHGALGDELQFSTLPEALSRQGHRVCLLANDNKEVLPFKNIGIREFVWGTNPFVDKEEEGSWNLGDLPNLYSNTQDSFIANWESAFGLNAPFSSYPKIYYEPKKLSVAQQPEAIVELSGASLKYNREEVIWLVRQIIKASPGINFKQLITSAQDNNIRLPELPEYHCASLYEIYDVLCGCKMLITLNSGIHSLAAAARRKNELLHHFCLLPQADMGWIMKSKKFIFPGIVYLNEAKEFN